MGDIWRPRDLWDSRYLWIPLEMSDGSMHLPSPQPWMTLPAQNVSLSELF
jgi:hypothetical protein